MSIKVEIYKGRTYTKDGVRVPEETFYVHSTKPNTPILGSFQGAVDGASGAHRFRDAAINMVLPTRDMIVNVTSDPKAAGKLKPLQALKAAHEINSLYKFDDPSNLRRSGYQARVVLAFGE